MRPRPEALREHWRQQQVAEPVGPPRHNDSPGEAVGEPHLMMMFFFSYLGKKLHL